MSVRGTNHLMRLAIIEVEDALQHPALLLRHLPVRGGSREMRADVRLGQIELVGVGGPDADQAEGQERRPVQQADERIEEHEKNPQGQGDVQRHAESPANRERFGRLLSDDDVQKRDG